MQKLDLIDGPVSFPGAAEVRPADGGGVVFSRLPRADRHLFAEMLAHVVRMTSGVRAAFRTDATKVVVRLHPTVLAMALPKGRTHTTVDLVVAGERIASAHSSAGTWVMIDGKGPGGVRMDERGEAVYEFDLSGEMIDLELWIPHDAMTSLASIEVNNGATVEASATDLRRKWVHYGSSISQCVEAASPTTIWPAVAAHLGGWNLTNLGFAGQCHLDPFVARHIASVPADRISVKAGINIAGSASMTERTFGPALHGFLDIVRNAHPEAELIVASPILCPPLETQPGPSFADPSGVYVTDGETNARDNALTLTWIREFTSAAVAQRADRGDGNIRYVDGLDLFGAADSDDLPDKLHPNAAGYVRMGERWHRLVG